MAHKSNSKFCTRKCKMQCYVYCDCDDAPITYINSNMALLRVRNHQTIIYSNVSENRARLANHPSTYKIPLFYQTKSSIY